MINQNKTRGKLLKTHYDVLPSLQSPFKLLQLGYEKFPMSTRSSQDVNKKISTLKKQLGFLPPVENKFFKGQSIIPVQAQQAETMREQLRIPVMQKNPNQEGEQKSNLTTSGIIKAYAANTNSGIVRTYNEDRVSIILSAQKPECNDLQVSFFAVYDGHGGATCAEFLRDNLHQFIFKENNFPKNPKDSIINGFKQAEQVFLSKAQHQDIIIDSSGSCACTVLFIKEFVYVANVGDSRAIMSISGGNRVHQLSNDHKPYFERSRIQQAGGQIYQAQAASKMVQTLLP